MCRAERVIYLFMFALEPSAPLLTRVQNELRLDFEGLRGEKLDKERAWKKPGSRGGSAAAAWLAGQCQPASQQLPLPLAEITDCPWKCWGM